MPGRECHHCGEQRKSCYFFVRPKRTYLEVLREAYELPDKKGRTTS